MHKSVLFLILTFPLFLTAQAWEWAPIGTRWYFPESYFISPNIGLVTYESIGDTLIDGQTARIIYKDNWTCNSGQGPFFSYLEAGKLYYRFPGYDQFELMIDFQAEPGEQWAAPLHWEEATIAFGDTIFYTVDSVGYWISPQDDSLRIQHVTARINFDEFDFSYPTEVWERIGFIETLIPSINAFSLCDGDWERSLRCYDDPTFGLVKLSDEACDFTPVKETSPPLSLKVAPNPGPGLFRIDGLPPDCRLRLFDGTGRQQWSDYRPQNYAEMDLSIFPDGIYFLQVWAEGRLRAIQKLVKTQ